ncbi:MAG TPA: glycosyltransferase family 39 protein [Terriglobales bacterium]|nr:glycosyltransferase family 39 protein [Terriglobales bacterium]
MLSLLASAAAADSRAGRPADDTGAAITPEFAKRLFDQVAPLREADGCRLARFDTGRSTIVLGLRSGTAAEHRLELATDPAAQGRRAGDWTVSRSVELERDCAATLAKIDAVLRQHAAPARAGNWAAGRLELPGGNYDLLAGCLVLLLAGTAWVLFRELRRQTPPAYAVLGLFGIGAAGLLLRLTLSPRTFLHEYFHIAETIHGYLSGNTAPIYGDTGPALFRFAGRVLGRPDDIEVVFLTNALLSALAVPLVALLAYRLLRDWPHALFAAALFCVWPQHLRFAAAEDLFVQAVTFGLWALWLFATHLDSRRLIDGVLAALAIALAMQARPEMLLFPAVLLGLALLGRRGWWRSLLSRQSLIAALLLAALLIPRAIDVLRTFEQGPAPASRLPELGHYLHSLVLFDAAVTPRYYWILLCAGLVWGLYRRPGMHLWLLLVYLGYTLFSLSLFANPPYNLRSQLLPNSFTILIAAGALPAWLAIADRVFRHRVMLSALVLIAPAAAWLIVWSPFVTELRDQQLQWRFLERAVPQLPSPGKLLAAIDVGGQKIDAFPTYLLNRHYKRYRTIDVRAAAAGEVAWPEPSADLIFYQGMYCHFAFAGDPPPEPLIPACRAVHERYRLEPLLVEDLATEGYSLLRYAREGPGVFRIGFYRAAGLR